MRKYCNLNPWVKFFPIFIFYTIFGVYIRYYQGMLWELGDELGYIHYAQNILKGYYSPPSPNIELWWGPGLPLILSLVLYFKINLFSIVVLSAFLLYASIVMVYRIVDKYLQSSLIASFSSFSLMAYYPLWRQLSHLNTELLSVFLIVSFVWFWLDYIEKRTRIPFILGAVSLAYLAITKVIFGYVIWVLLPAIFIVFLIKRKDEILALFVRMLFLSCIFTLPYLAYTYKITNKVFYWGNSGSVNLYRLSNPNPYSYGDATCHSQIKPGAIVGNSKIDAYIANLIYRDDALIRDSIMKLSTIEQDAFLKEKAFENIKKHPKTYLQNYIYNFFKIFFSIPGSARVEGLQTIIRLPSGSFYFLVFVMSSLFLIFKSCTISSKWLPLFLFFYIYFLGQSFLATHSRNWDTVYPLQVLLFAYLLYYVRTHYSFPKKTDEIVSNI